MGIFDLFKKRQEQRNGNYVPQTTSPLPQQPQVDTSNALGSLAEILGPSPAEREAQERRMQQNQSKMQAWTGLFDGLRQLANLYYTTKGASPMTFNDNPYQQVEKRFQQEQQRVDNYYRNRQAYAQQLWNLQRQVDQDKMRQEAHQAQMKWYDTRDEIAQKNAELNRLKAARVIKNKDGSLSKFDPVTGTLEQLSEADHLYAAYMEANTEYKKAQTAKANRTGGGRSHSGSRSTSSSDPFVELANQLNESPDVIGPILEQEGLGFYNKENKEFTFSKNATKGMATTATRRAATQRQRVNSSRNSSTNKSGFFNK